MGSFTVGNARFVFLLFLFSNIAYQNYAFVSINDVYTHRVSCLLKRYVRIQQLNLLYLEGERGRERIQSASLSTDFNTTYFPLRQSQKPFVLSCLFT